MTLLYKSPCGMLELEAGPAGLRRCVWTTVPAPAAAPCAHGLLAEAARQLDAYFLGALRQFRLPLDLRGTPFRRRVWQELLLIPWGSVITYGELARRVGLPGGQRAVAGACHCNPVSVIVPCHRVVGVRGLTGYAGGLDVKRRLLRLEGVEHL